MRNRAMWHISIVLITFQSGLFCARTATMNNCGGDAGDKYAEIVRGKSNNTFTCGDVGAPQENWNVRGANIFIVALCPSPTNNSNSCTRGDDTLYPVFSANRTTSNSSVVTVDPTAAGNNIIFENGTLSCNNASCPMDFIVPVSGTCSSEVTMTSSPWTVTTSCTFTQGNSTGNRYACQLVSSDDTVLVAWQPMSPNNLPSGTAQCNLQSALPSGESKFNNRVQVRPGRHFITAGNLVFRRPTAPAWTCSPPGIVTENHTVICTCTMTDNGEPAGTLLWVTGSSNNFDVNNPLVTSTGGASSVVLTKKLTRTDHGSQYRCDTKWSSNNTPGQQVYNVQVGYPPTTANLTVNFQITRNLIVNDNSTVTFKCEAIGGNPMSSISLSGPRATYSPSGPSPLTSQLTDTQCEDTGTFTCTAGNGYGKNATIDTALFVNCKPRSKIYDIGVVNFLNGSVVEKSSGFNVTAYPGPLIMSFAYFGQEENATTCQTHLDMWLKGTCVQSSLVYTHTCTVEVSKVCSAILTGFYQVNVTNSHGHAEFRLRILYNVNPTISPTPASYLSVTIGLAVVLSLGFIAFVFVVLWLWRRSWVLPCAEHKDCGSKDLTDVAEMTHNDRTLAVSSSLPETQAQVESGQYDDLKMPEVGVRSPYAELQQLGSSHRSLDEGPIYYNARH